MSAVVCAMVAGGGAPAAFAADVDGGYPTPRTSDPVEAPYLETDEPPPASSPEPVYRERPVEPRYEVEPPRAGRLAGSDEGCLNRREVRRKLRSEGWGDFDDEEYAGRFIFMEAERKANGREFDLVVDACTGDIVEAEPQNVRQRVSRRLESIGPPHYERWRGTGDYRRMPPPHAGRYDPRY